MADELAGFYAQHSGLIKTLGREAPAIAMAKMKDHLNQWLLLAYGREINWRPIYAVRPCPECSSSTVR